MHQATVARARGPNAGRRRCVDQRQSGRDAASCYQACYQPCYRLCYQLCYQPCSQPGSAGLVAKPGQQQRQQAACQQVQRLAQRGPRCAAFDHQQQAVRARAGVAALALLSWGESWHNNHHAQPTSARFGQSWRQPDNGWWVVRGFGTLGWARLR